MRTVERRNEKSSAEKNVDYQHDGNEKIDENEENEEMMRTLR